MRIRLPVAAGLDPPADAEQTPPRSSRGRSAGTVLAVLVLGALAAGVAAVAAGGPVGAVRSPVRVLYTLDEVVDGNVRYTATHQLVFNADNDWTDVTLAAEGPDALDGQVNQVVRRTPRDISAGWLRGELPVSTGGWLPVDTVDRFPEQAADVQSDPLPPGEGFVPGPLMNWSRTSPPPLNPEIGLSSVEFVTTDLTRDTATRLGLDARSLTEYRSDYDSGWVQQVVYQEGLPVPLTVHQVAPDGTLERMRVVALEQLSTVSLEPTVP